jgi:hypothetical protein
VKTFAAPSFARIDGYSKIFESTAKKRERNGRPQARARFMKRYASNKCVQRSAASEFRNILSALHAAPADAQR